MTTRPLFLSDSTVRSARALGGMVVIYRPLRPDELAKLERQEPQLLIMRIVPERELREAIERLEREIRNTQD